MKQFGRLFFLWILLLIPACGLLVEEGREVVAKVDGEPIRLNDVLNRIRALPFEERAKTNDDDKSVRLAARRSVLQELVFESLLAKEAKARDIIVTDEEVEEAFEKEEKHDNALNNLMEGTGSTADGHKKAHAHEDHSHRQVNKMREKLVTEKLLKLQLSNAVLQTYYDEHTQEFAISPPLASYELLVVDDENDEVIETICQKAIDEGKTLADALASVESPPPLVFSGITPLSSVSSLVPEMREKVRNLQVGEISQPFVLNPGGKPQYAAARVVNYVAQLPFDSVKGQIYLKLYKDFLDGLQESHEVVYYQEKLDYQLGR